MIFEFTKLVFDAKLSFGKQLTIQKNTKRISLNNEL